ncbi:MAG: hypothetical protein AAGD10_12890 [Myxococcota bacterium]
MPTGKPIFDDEELIGFLRPGFDGEWWLTLIGTVETTLGPDADPTNLIERARAAHRRYSSDDFQTLDD